MADLGCGFAGLRVSFIPSRERIGRDFYMGIGQTDPQNPQTRRLRQLGFGYRRAAAPLRPSILSKLPGPPTPLELTTAEVRLRAEAHEGTGDG